MRSCPTDPPIGRPERTAIIRSDRREGDRFARSDRPLFLTFHRKLRCLVARNVGPISGSSSRTEIRRDRDVVNLVTVASASLVRHAASPPWSPVSRRVPLCQTPAYANSKDEPVALRQEVRRLPLVGAPGFHVVGRADRGIDLFVPVAIEVSEQDIDVPSPFR